MPFDPARRHALTIRSDSPPALEAAQQAPPLPAEGPAAAAMSRQDVIDAYRRGVAVLIQALPMEDPAHDNTRLKLRQFGEFVATGIRNRFGDDVRDHFMTQVHLDFEQFCGLVQQPNICPETRQRAIQNLAEGVAVCAPGLAQHIEAGMRELQALTSVAQNFRHRLTLAIEYQIQDFLHQQQVCTHTGDEIHYVAAFFNEVAPQFGLPRRTDALMPRDLAQPLLDAGAWHVIDANPVERVIAQMAEDYLSRLEEFQAQADSMDLPTLATLLQKYQRDLKPQLHSLFGPVDDAVLFHCSAASNEERYWLISDITLLAASIARNLRDADVIAFSPAHVIGVPGAGLKLKQLGESLFYVSDTRQDASAIPEGRNTHRHQTLDRFVLEDRERGRSLLEQLDRLAGAPGSASTAQAVQEDFWKKMRVSLYREMKDAPGPQQAREIFEQTLALLDSDAARLRFAVEMLERAALHDPEEIVQIIFDHLPRRQLARDERLCWDALLLGLQRGQAQFATELIREMEPAMFSRQDNEGYTLLMHALECDQTEAARLLVDSMSAQQLSLQETNGNTALAGALIKAQSALAGAIIQKLNERQLNLQNVNGYTALMLALMHGQTASAKDIIDKSGRTLLLLRNYDGDTARAIALRCNETEIAQFLKEKSSRWLAWLYR